MSWATRAVHWWRENFGDRGLQPMDFMTIKKPSECIPGTAVTFSDLLAIIEPIANEEIDSIADQHGDIGIRSRGLARSPDGVMLMLGINVLTSEELKGDFNKMANTLVANIGAKLAMLRKEKP
jgi:hypothetical protein